MVINPIFDKNILDSRAVERRRALCISRGELSNEYLVAKVGFDTAEEEASKRYPLSVSK